MHPLATFNILGAPDDDGVGIFKLIVPIIIAVFWVVAQILSSLGDKKKKRTPPAEAEYPISLPSEVPPPQPIPQRAPKQQRPVKHRAQTNQQQRQNAQRSAPPPLQQRVNPQPTRQPAARLDPNSPILQAEVGSRAGSASSRGSVTSQQLRALLRPKSLKHAFILTEILQPPVGIRDDRV